MRLRRFCSLKKGDKCIVDEQTRADYLNGGEKREWLEIALLEAVKKYGVGRDVYKQVKAGLYLCAFVCMICPCTPLPVQGEFLTRIVVVRQRMLEKSQEIRGKWMTEERIKSCGSYTGSFGSNLSILI